MFDVNLTCSKNNNVCETAGVVIVGKDSKPGDRGTTMMFVGYAEHKSDSITIVLL